MGEWGAPDDARQTPSLVVHQAEVPPLPVPAAPVTGYATTPEGGRTRWVVIAVIAALVLGLMGTATLGLRYAYSRFAAPVAGTAGFEEALRERIRTDYPRFEVGKVETVDAPAQGDSGAQRRIFVTLRSIDATGFEFVAAYVAPDSERDSASAYENMDRFFRAGLTPSQPTTSFMEMWQKDHADTLIEAVLEVGDPSMPMRSYEVYHHAPGTGAAGHYLTLPIGYPTAYDTCKAANAAPTEMPSAPTDASTVTADVSPTPLDGSAVATDVIIHDAFPAFRIVGGVTDDQGSRAVVIAHKDFPRLRLVAYPDFLSLGMDATELFAKDDARARAFAKIWSRRHPATLIMDVDMHTDYSDPNRLSVFYSKSSTEVDVPLDQTAIDIYLYDPKTRTWKFTATE